MDFQSLPPEAFNQVLSFVDLPSLKIARLLSKQFSSHATTLLFANIEVWLQTTSLTHLVSITNDNNLSKQVRSLTITNDFIPTAILDPSGFIFQVYIKALNVKIGTQRRPRFIESQAANIVTFEDFVETGFNSRPELREQLSDAGWAPERLFSAWKRNRDIATEQRRLMTSDVDVEFRLTGGVGTGGVEKLLRNGLGETFVFGEIYRADGRQLTALLLAAARLSETDGLTPNTKFHSLIMEETYWDELLDKTTYDKTYVASDGLSQAHFGSISVNSIESALPSLSSVTTLEISLPTKNGERDVPSIERNLTLLLAGLPRIRNLSLHNSESHLVSLQRPLQTILSRSIHKIKLKNCIIHLAAMESFLSIQSSTLSTIHLENIALVGGCYDKFLSAIRNTAHITEFVTKRWLLEFADETCVYSPEEEYDEEDFGLISERRSQARREIAAFVQHEREDLPLELLCEDSIGRIRSDASGRIGIIEFIGETRFLSEED